MPITFFNEKTGQVVKLSREPQIAAFINSSDMSINASQGQNKGWKLDVDDKLRIEEMRQDPAIVQRIAQSLSLNPEDLRTQHFITEIINQDNIAAKMAISQINENPAHAEAYEARMKAARAAKKATSVKVEVADEPVVAVPVKSTAKTAKK